MLGFDLILLLLTLIFTFVSCISDDKVEPNWNFTHWWFERNENPQLLGEPLIFQEPTKILHQYSDLDKFDYVHYGDYNDSAPGVLVTSSPILVENNGTPATSILKLNDTILQFFSSSRHWNDDKVYLRDLRDALKEKFLSYGLKTAFHIFKAEENPIKLVSKKYLFDFCYVKQPVIS